MVVTLAPVDGTLEKHYLRNKWDVVWASLMYTRGQIPVATESPNEEGSTYTSGFFCVVEKAWNDEAPELEKNEDNWTLVDEEESIRIWRSSDRSNMILKEAPGSIGDVALVFTSIFKPWDVLNGDLVPIVAAPCSQRSLNEEIQDMLQGLAPQSRTEYLRNVAVLLAHFANEAQQGSIIQSGIEALIPFVPSYKSPSWLGYRVGVLHDLSSERCNAQMAALWRNLIRGSDGLPTMAPAQLANGYTTFQNARLCFNALGVPYLSGGALLPTNIPKIQYTVAFLGMPMDANQILTRLGKLHHWLAIPCKPATGVMFSSFFQYHVVAMLSCLEPANQGKARLMMEHYCERFPIFVTPDNTELLCLYECYYHLDNEREWYSLEKWAHSHAGQVLQDKLVAKFKRSRRPEVVGLLLLAMQASADLDEDTDRISELEQDFVPLLNLGQQYGIARRTIRKGAAPDAFGLVVTRARGDSNPLAGLLGREFCDSVHQPAMMPYWERRLLGDTHAEALAAGFMTNLSNLVLGRFR